MIEIYDCLNQIISKTELRFVQTVIDLRARPKGVYLIYALSWTLTASVLSEAAGIPVVIERHGGRWAARAA